MIVVHSHVRARAAGRWLLALTSIALVVGCKRPLASLTLIQPDAPAAQRLLNLSSHWAHQDESDGMRAILLAFPLPHTPDGPRDFEVFVQMPTSAEFHVLRVEEHTDPDSPPVASAGLFVQAVGERRRATPIVAGTIRYRDGLLTRPRVSIDLDCADGTRIRGEARLTPGRSEIRMFRERFAAELPSHAQD